MRISDEVRLYGGGPGSGCNPEAGKCGRHKAEMDEEESHLASMGWLKRGGMPSKGIVRYENKKRGMKLVTWVQDGKRVGAVYVGPNNRRDDSFSPGIPSGKGEPK